MSNEKNDALAAMLAQYEASNKPKFEKSDSTKAFDMNNYFTIYDLDKNEDSKTKEVRILQNPKGGSPIVEFWGHTKVVDGKKRTFPCLEHEKGTACPFCEAREGLLAEGDQVSKDLAKTYAAKKMYIVKLIDRQNEDHGVKFWRFNSDYNKKGAYDMIMGVVSGLKKFKDITHPEEGRDLTIMITRSPSGAPVVSSIVAQDSDVLSNDETKKATWLADDRTWESVYSTKNYEYLAIVVLGGIPVWDSENKCWVDKNKSDASNNVPESESEITMGVENVKENIKVAETVTNPMSTTEDEDTDDLPF